MATIYLVMERTFFYTDEVYIPLDGDSLDHAENPQICTGPQKIFLDRAKAEAYAAKLNMCAFAGFRPSYYAFSAEEISPFQEEELLRQLKAILGEEWQEEMYWGDLSIPVDLREEKLQQVAALFRFAQYAVVEAEMDIEELQRHLVQIIGEEIADCPKMTTFTLPGRLSLDELQQLAAMFHLDAFSLDRETILNTAD